MEGAGVVKGSRVSARDRWIAIGKTAATIGILYVVFERAPVRDVVEKLGQLRISDVAALAAITFAQVAVGVVRWWRLLVRLGERVPFEALFGDVLVGLMYNLFLPTTVGGDVVRAWRASTRAKVRHRAWSTSIFERVAGLLAMATTGGIAALVGVGAMLPELVRSLAVGVALLFAIAFFVVAAPFRLLVRVAGSRLGTVASDLHGIVSDLEGPLAAFGARAEALGWSLLYQALGIVFVVVGARALGAPGHELAILVGIPLVHLLSMVPITFGGHGLREGLFVGILGLLGVPPGVALSLAAQWLASSVAFAVAGGLVALVSPRGASRRNV